MLLSQPHRAESTSPDTDSARLLVVQFARALAPFLNDTATYVDSLQETPDATDGEALDSSQGESLKSGARTHR